MKLFGSLIKVIREEIMQDCTQETSESCKQESFANCIGYCKSQIRKWENNNYKFPPLKYKLRLDKLIKEIEKNKISECEIKRRLNRLLVNSDVDPAHIDILNNLEFTEYFHVLFEYIIYYEYCSLGKPISDYYEKLKAYGLVDTNDLFNNPLEINLFNGSNQRNAVLKRLHNLKISKTILPQCRLIASSSNPNDTTEARPLLDTIKSLWEKETWHTFIICEGGTGKTISLKNLWDLFLNIERRHRVIPIYIDLTSYNIRGNEKNFIIKYIGRYYLNIANLRADEENDLWRLISQPQIIGGERKPSVLLLLDGFNEVTVNTMNLEIELKELVERAHGTQIVITSRSKVYGDFHAHTFNKAELLPLSDKQIDLYIKDVNEKNREICTEDFSNISKPEGDLLKLVRNPMMLTLYTATCSELENDPSNNFKRNPKTFGEIIWNYLQSNILRQSNFLKYKLILNHLMPHIGYKMEKDGQFSITRQELREYIDEAYKSFNNEDFYNTFSEFDGHTNDLEFEISNPNDKGIRFNKILEILTNQLTILINEEKNSFRFSHQHFRDFFAALYIINIIEIGIRKAEIPLELKNRALPGDVRRFVGEIAGEHHNKPKLSNGMWVLDIEERDILTSALYHCRHKFGKDEIGFAVWNIIEIIKKSREELTGCDLSYLDLYSIRLNGVICSRWSGDSFLAANFDGAKLDEINLLSFGHSSSIDSAVYSKDGKKILSASFDHTIKEWNVSTGKCIHTYKGHKDWVRSAIYSPDGTKILSVSRDKTIKEWLVGNTKL